MISLYDVLKASKGLPVRDPIACHWGRKLGGGAAGYDELTGAPPLTFTANGENLLDYRIYGASGGVGEQTENLFDFNRQISYTFKWDSTKYIYGAIADRPTPEPEYIKEFVYNSDSFTVLSTGGPGIGFLVDVKPNTTYTVLFQCDVTVPGNRTSAVLNLIASDGTFGTFWGVYGDDRSSTFTTNADTAYVYMVFRVINFSTTFSNIMLTESSTAPTSYIPYGYKLTLLSGSTPVDIYIGDTSLASGEYVSYGEQKVYKYVGGELTPTDPPVELPALPTIDGETIVDFDNTPKPSEVYIKYPK